MPICSGSSSGLLPPRPPAWLSHLDGQWHLPLDWPDSASLPWIHVSPSRSGPLPPRVLHNPPGSRNGTQGTGIKNSRPARTPDSFLIRSGLFPGLVQGTGIKNSRPARTLRFVPYSFRALSWACPRGKVGVKTLASGTVAFSLIPNPVAFSVGEMSGFLRNGAWEELVIPNAIALAPPVGKWRPLRPLWNNGPRTNFDSILVRM